MKPIKKVLLQDAIISEIISYIKKNNLKTGDKLPSERILVKDLEVSRPVVREALKALEAGGIIKTKHGSGTYLNSIDTLLFSRYEKSESQNCLLEKLKQLAYARLMVETTTMKNVSKFITKEDLERLYKHENDENEFLKNEPYNISVNIDFEIMISEINGNPFITDYHKNINELWKKYYALLNAYSFPVEVRHEDHLNILKAIESKDEKKIEKYASLHIMRVIDSCEKLLTNSKL